jgi:hypothetical protein
MKRRRTLLKFRYSLIALCALLTMAGGISMPVLGAPLQGHVDDSGVAPARPEPLVPMEPMPAPVLPAKKIQGNVDKTDKGALSGNAEDEDDGQLQSMKAKPDSNGVLKGNASLEDGALSKQDPDADDQELQVQWDRWRNRFLQAVQSGVQEALNNPSETNLRWDPQTQMMVIRFPLGTVAWFSCQITDQRQIKNIKLLHSSGFPNYDKAVLESVQSLDGSSILKYPARSRRSVVSQMAGVKTSESSEQQYFHFGDVERYRQ